MGYVRRKAPRLTISQILDQMQDIADTQFQGDLQGNVYQIYNQLSQDDKKTFLRKSLGLHWENQITLGKVGLEDVVIDDKVAIDRTSVIKERENVNKLTYDEQEKLKNWLFRAFFVVGCIGLIAIVGLTVIVGGDGADLSDILSYMKKLFELLF